MVVVGSGRGGAAFSFKVKPFDGLPLRQVHQCSLGLGFGEADGPYGLDLIGCLDLKPKAAVTH